MVERGQELTSTLFISNITKEKLNQKSTETMTAKEGEKPRDEEERKSHTTPKNLIHAGTYQADLDSTGRGVVQGPRDTQELTAMKTLKRLFVHQKPLGANGAEMSLFQPRTTEFLWIGRLTKKI